LPGVFGIEAFAEAASLLVAQDSRFLGAEDVRRLARLVAKREGLVQE